VNQARQFDIRFATPVEAPDDVSRETLARAYGTAPVTIGSAYGKAVVEARQIGWDKWIVVELDHDQNLIRESTDTFTSAKLAAWHWAYDGSMFDEPMAFEAWVTPMWATTEGEV
jgi:hypothetical protein